MFRLLSFLARARLALIAALAMPLAFAAGPSLAQHYQTDFPP